MTTKSDRPQIIQNVVNAAANEYGVTADDIFSNRKSKSIADARSACGFILRHRTQMSFPEIGRALGGKHHTTVMYAVRKFAGDNDRLARAARIARTIDDTAAVCGALA